jgi:hypothetical protein
VEAGDSGITVSVSYWRRRMHSAQGEMRRMAGARQPRWGSTNGSEKDSKQLPMDWGEPAAQF